MTAPEILDEIRTLFRPMDVEIGSPGVSSAFRNENEFGAGVRPQHVVQMLSDPALEVDGWDLGESALKVIALAPCNDHRKAPVLLVSTQNPHMPLTVDHAWKLAGQWEASRPTELFAEFVSRYGVVIEVGQAGERRGMYLGQVTLPGDPSMRAPDATEGASIEGAVRRIPGGLTEYAWVYGIRTKEYQRDVSR